MGWWNDTKNDVTVELGDGPLDIMDGALKRIAKAYKNALKRNPTVEELSEIIESELRILQEDILDDMEERELESVVIKMKSRPKRPRLQAGDYFAVPLRSGGYGYCRIIKIKYRVLIWTRLLNIRSTQLLSLKDMDKADIFLDLKTRTQKLISLEWPVIGSKPLTDKEKKELHEPQWVLGLCVGSFEDVVDWKLSGKKGMPNNMGSPYLGYRDIIIRPKIL